MAEVTNFSIGNVPDEGNVVITIPVSFNSGDYILYSSIVTKLDAIGKSWQHIRNVLNEGFSSNLEAQHAVGIWEVSSEDNIVLRADPKTNRIVFYGVSEGASNVTLSLFVTSAMTLVESTPALATIQVPGNRYSEESRPSAPVWVSLKQIADLQESGPLENLFLQDFENKDDAVSAMYAAGLMLPGSAFTYEYIEYYWVFNHRSDGTSDVFVNQYGSEDYIQDQNTDLITLTRSYCFMLPSAMGGAESAPSSGLQLTIVNNLPTPVYVGDVYATIPVHGRISFVRSPSDLPSMYALNKLIESGAVTAVWEPIED